MGACGPSRALTEQEKAEKVEREKQEAEKERKAQLEAQKKATRKKRAIVFKLQPPLQGDVPKMSFRGDCTGRDVRNQLHKDLPLLVPGVTKTILLLEGTPIADNITIHEAGVAESSTVTVAVGKPEVVSGAGLGDDDNGGDSVPTQDCVLKGHAQSSAVDMLRITPKHNILWSCGDDKTARRWKINGTFDTKSILRHKTSVWCVLPLEDGRVVTGSAASHAMEVLQIWAPEKEDLDDPGSFSRQTQLTGHTDAVTESPSR